MRRSVVSVTFLVSFRKLLDLVRCIAFVGEGEDKLLILLFHPYNRGITFLVKLKIDPKSKFFFPSAGQLYWRKIENSLHRNVKFQGLLLYCYTWLILSCLFIARMLSVESYSSIKIVLRSGILTSRRAGHFEHILKMRLFFLKTGHQAGTMNPLVMVKTSNESYSENCENG